MTNTHKLLIVLGLGFLAVAFLPGVSMVSAILILLALCIMFFFSLNKD